MGLRNVWGRCGRLLIGAMALGALTLGVAMTGVPWGPVGVAQAQSPEASRAFEVLYEQARSAYDRGDYATAAQLLQQAYELDPDPNLLWNIGRSHERAGELAEAILAYQDFIAKAPAAEERSQAQQRLFKLKADFGQGWLTVRANVGDAMASIDDGPPQAMPLERKMLPVGEYWVEIRAPGRTSSKTRVTLASGEETVIAAELPRMGSGQDATIAMSGTGASGGPTDLKTPGWVTFGIGVAVAATGGVLLGLAHADANEVNDASTVQVDGETVITGVSRSRAQDLSDSADVKSAAGVGLLAAGGASLLTGIILLSVDAANDTQSARSDFHITPSWNGVVLGGTF